MSSRSQAGSLSDFNVSNSKHESNLIHGYYQLSRYMGEPWDYRSNFLGLGPESYAYWITRKQGRPQQRQQFRDHAPPVSETFLLPVSAITALHTNTHSSTDSDDSHYSTPASWKLVKDSDESCLDQFFAEPEPDSDQDEDVFENLNVAIIHALAPDLRLAAGVIANLYELPPHLRAFVHGFVRHQGHGDHGGNSEHGRVGTTLPAIAQSSPTNGNTEVQLQSSEYRRPEESGISQPTPGLGERPLKRKRRYIGDDLKYACPFNIFNRRKYCIKHEAGSTGRHYLSCMGPGWAALRHMKEHFARTHRTPQCQRCWQKFDSPEELSFHRDKEEVRCEDRTHLIHEKESITESEWTKIDKALAVPRPKKGTPVEAKKDHDRWFEVWEILFPPETYPNLRKPTHPHYVDPVMLVESLPTRSETERMIEIFKAMWDKKAEDMNGKYHPSQQEVVRMIREANFITDKSAQFPGKQAQDFPTPFHGDVVDAVELGLVPLPAGAVRNIPPASNPEDSPLPSSAPTLPSFNEGPSGQVDQGSDLYDASPRPAPAAQVAPPQEGDFATTPAYSQDHFGDYDQPRAPEHISDGVRFSDQLGPVGLATASPDRFPMFEESMDRESIDLESIDWSTLEETKIRELLDSLLDTC